jgi:predicted Zn-dependent peptidase
VIVRASIGAVVLAFCCVLVAPAQAVAPSVSTSAGVTILRQPDEAATLAGIDTFVLAGLDRQSLAQNGLAALTAQAILETPVSFGPSGGMLPLETAISAAGGSITFDVDPDDVRFYVEGLGSNSDALLTMFSQVLAAPAFDPKTLDAARADLDRQIAQNEQVPFTVGVEMLDRQFFTQANAGLPEFGTATSLAQFVTADVRAFYARNYRRGGAVVSAVGAPAALSSGALERLAGVLRPGSSKAVVAKIPALKASSREMITHRDISAPWMVAQFAAPALTSKDFAPMLVLAALVDKGLADAAGMPTLVSRTLATGSVGSVYNYSQRPANLVIYVDGGSGDASTTFANTLAFVKVIDSVKLTGSFDRFKAIAQGDYIAGASDLSDRALLAGIFAMNGGSTDYLSATLAAIAAVTPADVQRVARKYLGDPTVALIVPRESNSQ